MRTPVPPASGQDAAPRTSGRDAASRTSGRYAARRASGCAKWGAYGRGGIAGFLFALGLVVVQLGSAAHLLLVHHARCVHGEMVHDGDTHEARALDASGDRSGDEAASEGDPGSSHDEDHCDVLAVTHRIPDAPAPLGAATLLTILPTSELAAALEVRPVRLLHVAPKGSPPSA